MKAEAADLRTELDTTRIAIRQLDAELARENETTMEQNRLLSRVQREVSCIQAPRCSRPLPISRGSASASATLCLMPDGDVRAFTPPATLGPLLSEIAEGTLVFVTLQHLFETGKFGEALVHVAPLWEEEGTSKAPIPVNSQEEKGGSKATEQNSTECSASFERYRLFPVMVVADEVRSGSGAVQMGVKDAQGKILFKSNPLRVIPAEGAPTITKLAINIVKTEGKVACASAVLETLQLAHSAREEGQLHVRWAVNNRVVENIHGTDLPAEAFERELPCTLTATCNEVTASVHVDEHGESRVTHVPYATTQWAGERRIQWTRRHDSVFAGDVVKPSTTTEGEGNDATPLVVWSCSGENVGIPSPVFVTSVEDAGTFLRYTLQCDKKELNVTSSTVRISLDPYLRHLCRQMIRRRCFAQRVHCYTLALHDEIGHAAATPSNNTTTQPAQEQVTEASSMPHPNSTLLLTPKGLRLYRYPRVGADHVVAEDALFVGDWDEDIEILPSSSKAARDCLCETANQPCTLRVVSHKRREALVISSLPQDAPTAEYPHGAILRLALHLFEGLGKREICEYNLGTLWHSAWISGKFDPEELIKTAQSSSLIRCSELGMRLQSIPSLLPCGMRSHSVASESIVREAFYMMGQRHSQGH